MRRVWLRFGFSFIKGRSASELWENGICVMPFGTLQVRDLDLRSLVLEVISPINKGPPSSHWHGGNGNWNCTRVMDVEAF
jgi:hypothetical protein